MMIISQNKLRRFDLHLLTVLHTVLQTRNVTAAARRLNMSQPAVSRALTRLRLLFKDQLFVKGPRGVIPTPRAEDLAVVVARLLAEIGNAVEQPTFDPASADRVFRIATTDYGALAALGHGRPAERSAEHRNRHRTAEGLLLRRTGNRGGRLRALR